MQSSTTYNRQYAAVLLLLLLVSGWLGREVYMRLILPAAPLNFDEAAHSLPAWYLLRDMRNLDWRAFRGDFHIQMLWPPMFSLLQMPFLALLGHSDESARIFAYICLVLAVLMGCAIARRVTQGVSPELAPMAALVSGLLALSSPGWLFVGSWANQETPVALVVFVVFWLFLKALDTRKPIWFAATSLGLYALFLTKYNYAAFALAAVGLIDFVERIKELRKSTTAKFLHSQFFILNFILLYLPLALGVLYWFFGATDIEMARPEEKWKHFRFFVTNEDTGYPFWSEQNLLFYVRAAANWLMPNIVWFVASLVGAGYAVVRVRHAGVRLLVVFFGLGFVLATVHQLKAERYIAPLFPSLWLLAGLGYAEFVRRQRSSRIFMSSVIFCLIALNSILGSLPRLQPVWAGDVAKSTRFAAQRIVNWQDGNKPVLIIGTFGELSPPLFEWRLRPLPVFAAHGNIQYDAPPGEGTDLERVQRWATQNPGTQITLIKIEPDSPLFNTDDMQKKNLWRQKLVSEFEANHESLGYRLTDSKTYPAGVSVSFYLPQ